MMIGLLVLDVLSLTPACWLELREEASTPEREVVTVDCMAGAAARGLEVAEGGVGFELFGDLLDGLESDMR